jgi:predicted DNA-binding protein (UPF0278 family)
MRDSAMKKDGLQRMLDFLNYLREKKIHFYIEQYSSDELTVTLTLVGVRVEVMFSVDDMTFSVFPGKEDVLTDHKLLYELIKRDVE